jgi:hypothetical protein
MGTRANFLLTRKRRRRRTSISLFPTLRPHHRSFAAQAKARCACGHFLALSYTIELGRKRRRRLGCGCRRESAGNDREAPRSCRGAQTRLFEARCANPRGQALRDMPERWRDASPALSDDHTRKGDCIRTCRSYSRVKCNLAAIVNRYADWRELARCVGIHYLCRLRESAPVARDHSLIIWKQVIAVLLLACVSSLSARAQDEKNLEFQPAASCNASAVKNEAAVNAQWYLNFDFDAAPGDLNSLFRRPELSEARAAPFLTNGPTQPALIHSGRSFDFRLTYVCADVANGVTPKWHIIATPEQTAGSPRALGLARDGLVPVEKADKLSIATDDRLAEAVANRTILPIALNEGIYRMRFESIRTLFGDPETLLKIDCLVLPYAIAIDRWADSKSEPTTQIAIPLVVGAALPNGRSCKRIRRVRGQVDTTELQAPLFGSQLFAPRIGLFDAGRVAIVFSPYDLLSIPWTLSAGDVSKSDFLISLPALQASIKRQRTRERLSEVASAFNTQDDGHQMDERNLAPSDHRGATSSQSDEIEANNDPEHPRTNRESAQISSCAHVWLLHRSSVAHFNRIGSFGFVAQYSVYSTVLRGRCF